MTTPRSDDSEVSGRPDLPVDAADAPFLPEEPAIPSVARETASGVVWMTAQKWTVRLFSFFTIALLTRALTPADFGVVAAAGTVLPFFYLLADLGFAAYIVQVKETDERMLSTGFWFSSVAGLALWLLMVALAPLLGLIFRDPQVTPVLQGLAVCVVLYGLSSVPMALLRRQMRFQTIAWQGAVAALIAQVAAVVMALTGMGVWALVVQAVVAPAVVMVLSWVTVHWRPGFTFSRSDFTAMARYGSQVLGVELVAMTRAWAEAAIVSASLGMTGLGFLNIAQRLVQVVQELTGAALVPVSTVSFAKIRTNVERLRQGYFRALRMAYFVLSPPLTLLAVAGPLIIPVVFGDGWDASQRTTQILALAGTLTVGAALDHGLFYGLGRPGRWFVYAVIVDACTVGMTALTVPYGLESMALGFLGVALAATAVRWFLVARLVETGPWVVAGPFWFLATAVVASGAAGLAAVAATQPLLPIIRILIVGLTVLVVYLAVARLMARTVLAEVAKVARRSRWARRLPLPVDAKED